MNKRKRPDALTADPNKRPLQGGFVVYKYKSNSGNCQIERYFWITLAVLLAALIAGQLCL